MGPIWDTVYSQTEEPETSITEYEKAIICQKQVTLAIKHDTGWIVRIATEIEQTAGHHWYAIFMRYVPSANGISHLMLHPMIIVLLCCILLVLLLICFYIYVYHISRYVESMHHCLLPDLGLSDCTNLPPALTPGEARGLTIPPLAQAVVLLGVWSMPRGECDCPLSSGLDPTHCSSHGLMCAGAAIGGQ